MRVPGLPRLYVSLLLGRVAGQMLGVGFVLFVLARYHSPQLAGAATFLLVVPGLVLSPIAGALLDRYSRARLITVDYMVATVGMFTLAGLSAGRLLPPALLLVICFLSSLTGPLSFAGARAIMPSIVPDHLWERANALDNTTFVLATVFGAPLAGGLVAFAGPEWALVGTGALFAAAGVSIFGVRDKVIARESAHVFGDAWSGLVYVLRNRTLTGLALTFFVYGVGWGGLAITIPVLVLGRLHQSPAVVGYIFGAAGIGGIVATLIAGRIRTRGRERQLMAGSMLGMAVAVAILPFAMSVLLVALGLVLAVLAEAPFDVAFLTLRQRRTDPAQFGRVFAVSVSLNMLGSPIGAAIAGPLVARSLDVALWAAVVFTLLAAVFPLVTIPATDK